ncbi:MAG TPA: nucleotidyl transferase AbiEii/AbiGii toxin family protein [Minicystis sp.]|nr:nucleotidyl transferase AbiEii/AbiGii toxin family protein [Minicystis sp.]
MTRPGRSRYRGPFAPTRTGSGFRFGFGAALVRVELVREARVPLGEPARVSWARVPCLAIVDCFTEKLLANADRGADPDDLSRDLIDLAALRLAHGAVPDAAWSAATAAYGPSVRADLARAVDRFLGDAVYRDRCAERLTVRDPEAIRRGVEVLRARSSDGSHAGPTVVPAATRPAAPPRRCLESPSNAAKPPRSVMRIHGKRVGSRAKWVGIGAKRVGLRVQDLGIGVQDMAIAVQDMGVAVQDTGVAVQDTGPHVSRIMEESRQASPQTG